MKTSFTSKQLSANPNTKAPDLSTHCIFQLKKGYVVKLLSALIASIIFTTTEAYAISRSCSAKLYISKSDVTGVPEEFSATGDCGSGVPNRCRKRARDAAQELLSNLVYGNQAASCF